MRRASRGDLQPHGEPELPLRQFALQRLAQVLHFFLVDPQVGIARDAELRVVHYFATREELMQVRVHDRREQHERVVRSGDFRRHLDHARHQPRRLDDRHGGLAAEGVASGQLDDEVETLIHYLRKRVRRIEPDGGEERPDLMVKIFGDPGPLRGAAVSVVQHADASRLQRGQDLPVENVVHFRDQLLCTLADFNEIGSELLQGRADQRRLQAQLFAQARNPDLEELVEVAAYDAQETQPLEQRRGRILGERQHPAVERQDRQLAIDHRRIGFLAGSRTRGGRDRGHGRARGGR